MKHVLQLENTNAKDFKDEIILGVIAALKSFAPSLQNKDNEILLTREETCKMLKISLVTLWDWTRKDIIPAHRISNKVRYKKHEILNALNQKNQFDKS